MVLGLLLKMGVSFQQGGPPSFLVLGLSLVKKRLN